MGRRNIRYFGISLVTYHRIDVVANLSIGGIQFGVKPFKYLIEFMKVDQVFGICALGRPVMQKAPGLLTVFGRTVWRRGL